MTQQIEALNASLATINASIKEHAEKVDKELKNHATLSQETRASVDELLTKQGELNARLQAAEQAVADKGGNGGSHQAESIGQMFTAQDGFDSFAASAARGSRFSAQFQAAAIDSKPGSAGTLIVPDRLSGVRGAPDMRLTVRDLIAWGRTTSNNIEYVKEKLFTNAAGPVAEGALKPESGLTFEAANAPIATIAHWIQATRQVLSDASMLQSYIDGRLRYGLKLKEEDQLLNGSGTGQNLNGIMTQATVYADPGVNPVVETRLDRLRLAMLQVEMAEFYADGIVISPVDWAAIELTKTADNAYLFANPQNYNAPGLWGRNVVPTRAIDSGDFLVGQFGGGVAVQGWDREDVTVMVSLEDRDNFVKNMVTILCEERIGLTVFNDAAFVKGNFSDLAAGGGGVGG